MKRRIAIACCIIAVLAMISTGTLAYITKEATARNVVTTGNVRLKIREKTDTGEDFPAEGITILPGDTISKIVTIENVGTHSIYLRVKLTKGVDDENLSAEECIHMDINTEDWTYRDGYYYYNHVLNARETTEELMSEVSVDGKKVDNEYRGKTFTVKIDAQAVQSENNGETVWDAAGWEEK